MARNHQPANKLSVSCDFCAAKIHQRLYAGLERFGCFRHLRNLLPQFPIRHLIAIVLHSLTITFLLGRG